LIWRNPFKQALLLMRRRRAARRIGVRFTRSRDWSLPTRLLVGGNPLSVSAPDEPGTRLAFLDILIDDCYGLSQARKPIQRIIDIGAHSGFFSLHAKMLFPDAVVHAYEPNPALAPFIENQARAATFKWFPEAVGAKAGFVSLQNNPDSVCARTVGEPGGQITMTSFSAAIERIGTPVDFLKLDCEGAEWDILNDAESFAAVRHIGMEYHLFDGHTQSELTGRLSRLGFTIKFMRDDGPDYGRLWAARQ